MKAKSRKRLLISSVAMLLVAMLALGTATFAWFTNNTSTTASGINVKTVQASDLKVASSDYSFTNDLKYDYNNQVFKPASSANGVAWYSGTAEKSNAFGIKSTDTFTPIGDVTANNDYVYANELNIRNYGGAAVDDVKIDFTIAETATTEGENYVRVAVVPKDAHNATSATAGLRDFDKSVFDTDGTAYDAVSGTASTAVTSITPENNKFSVPVGNLAAKGAAWSTTGSDKNEANYEIFVWFEGQDTHCTNANAGNSLPSITFTISGTQATAP
ncbi:MAG: hypothetical protein Q4A46_01965 [Clostridia bacterium]|nr:hypothetical protein [Clostridia bacterium]